MSRRGIGLYTTREAHLAKLTARQQDLIQWVIISSISTLVVQGLVVPTFEESRQAAKVS
ncbi:MAG: hypothetical protein M0027_16485 [Candidatus Dormibacteraeota bacterium]|jgi:hypothetical protein|nr:hypothetical protein [Candidatus Dormibacteraeota bacterium]